MNLLTRAPPAAPSSASELEMTRGQGPGHSHMPGVVKALIMIAQEAMVANQYIH